MWFMFMEKRDVTLTDAISIFNIPFLSLRGSDVNATLYNIDKQTRKKDKQDTNNNSLLVFLVERLSHVSWKIWINLDCFFLVMENK